jgi:hypothetical protein
VSLIFHRFVNEMAATAFGVSMRSAWPDLEWSLCSSQEHSNAIDPFPWKLTPPIVLVDRPHDEDEETERAIEALAVGHGAVFAGT